MLPLIICSSQADLLQLLQPFGTVSKAVLLRAKNQVGSFLFLLVVAALFSERSSMRGIDNCCAAV